MKIVFMMLPVALLLGFGFLAAFIWLTFNGQFDDLETPAHRILIEDDSINKPGS
jgi:cbb3-type cytochrome oxidase maturation protein